MKKLFAVIEVLYRGKELSRKEVWKNAQILTGMLTSILASVAIILGVDVSDAQINQISLGIVAAVGVFNMYVTAATSSSVGLPANDRIQPPDPGP